MSGSTQWVACPFGGAEGLATIEYRSAVNDYLETEVLPYVSDAWVDHAKIKIGYEIPVTRGPHQELPVGEARGRGRRAAMKSISRQCPAGTGST